MSSGNPVKKTFKPLEVIGQQVGQNTEALGRTIMEDPGHVAQYGVTYLNQARAGYDAVKRYKNDAIDQGERKANEAAAEYARAEVAAADAAPKTLSEMSLERRRRAQLARSGRGGTDLTSGTSLGSVDVVRKTLLGM